MIGHFGFCSMNSDPSPFGGGTMPDRMAAGKTACSRPRPCSRLAGDGGDAMQVFDLRKEQAWDPKKHVERILGEVEEGDVTVACWEPGQISPYHCHPDATEIYFRFEGGGRMRTPR